ncbi:MAG: preprotein translocase subunit SecE [Candidatus Margulisbacteria bacterium]|nr:preprotein translocase subunit SecE [Candidatus Margulisiibacteriota bacterium]
MNNIFGRLVKFFKETRSELKKVVWPDRRYVMVATMIVLVLVILTAMYVMAIDFTFSRLFGFLLK